MPLSTRLPWMIVISRDCDKKTIELWRKGLIGTKRFSLECTDGIEAKVPIDMRTIIDLVIAEKNYPIICGVAKRRKLLEEARKRKTTETIARNVARNMAYYLRNVKRRAKLSARGQNVVPALLLEKYVETIKWRLKKLEEMQKSQPVGKQRG